jgi:hypothetical protein
MSQQRSFATLVGLLVALCVAAAPAAANSSLPGSGYAWAQPGTAHVSTPHAQPPSWIPIGSVPAFHPVSGYAWAQPGTAPVTTPGAQPPSWIPIA